MPYKDRQKYLEYQKAYYLKRKRQSGLTRQRISNPAVRAAFDKLRNPIPQNQPVAATPATSGVYASIPSIPVNPAKANPISWGTTISETTRQHVEKLRMEGWEIDDVGNARRRV